MDLTEIRVELTRLHEEAGSLFTEVLHTRPSLKLVLLRSPLEALEDRLDEHLRRFVPLDAELIAHANAPADINTALRNSAQFSFYTAVRDSVRGLLTETSASLGSTRSRLDFIGSLALSATVLIVAVIALFV